MLDHLAPETGFSARLVLANRWLWDPLLSRALGASPDAAPMVRTTAAATIVEGGVQENVLPRRARAVINFRLAPGDTVDAVVAHVERVVDDPRVTVRVVGEPREASPISVADGEAWTLLARTIREIHDGAVVVPFLVPGGTDARHYRALSDAVYRFKPGLATPDLLERMHGTDERVAIEDHALAIRFYVRLIEQAAGG
jgi:carboxypeptidase PM20D1